VEIKCGNCGYKTKVTADLIKTVIGGSMIFGGAAGWVTYAFAGLLGFYGGAALIAGLLLAGGSAVLIGKDLNLSFYIAQKIADLLNSKGYQCGVCKAIDWQFSGFEDADVIAGDEHKRELWIALTGAKKELYIASGFLSSNVVNEHFVQELESALVRRVSVYLIVSDVRSHGSDWMKPGYNEALSILTKLSEKYSNLQLIQTHTHQKGIVVDDRYAITGSFNFLSNQNLERKETSLKVYESKAIGKVKRELLKN
jgi:hypothetical protein